MKLKKLMFGLITLCVIAPLSTKAKSSLSIDCGKNVIVPNGILKCTLKGNTDFGVTSVTAHLTLGENLTLGSADVYSYWAGDATNGEYDLAADASPYPKGDIIIGNFELKASDVKEGVDTKISIVKPLIGDESFNEIELDTIEKSIRIASSVNTLKKLTIDKKEIDLTKELNYEVDAESVEIVAEATHSKAKVEDAGKHDLKYGVNEIVIKVTSEAGTVKEYKLNVTRLDNRNTDNTLASLKINGEDVDLTKELTFELDLDKIKIEAQANDARATISGDVGEFDLKKGENNFTIKVKAENESEKEYKIKIITPTENGKDQPLDKEPQTGVNYPIIMISILCLLSVSAYVVIKNKNKIFKI